MAGSIVLKLACVLLACMVLYTEAVPQCGPVISKLAPCLSYLKSGGDVPKPCCTGITSLVKMTKTTPSRQDACNCLKKAAADAGGINPALAAGLPGKCGVSIPYKISASTDCAKVK